MPGRERSAQVAGRALLAAAFAGVLVAGCPSSRASSSSEPCRTRECLARASVVVLAGADTKTAKPICAGVVVEQSEDTTWLLTAAHCGASHRDREHQLFVRALFFGPDVPGRAAVLVHESRHWDGCRDHTDNEQDSSFRDGGAYSWQAVWLQWYATAAINAPEELRCSAQCTANAILASKFETDVGFRVAGAPNCGC